LVEVEVRVAITMVTMRASKLVVTLVVAVVAVVLLIEAPREVSGLNNGLALTPPMGWLSWERFRCNVDCDSYPDSCISEQLYMDMADELVEGGYADLGYVFVNVDDCWAEKERDNVTIGTMTCGGYPGSYGHYELDAQTFAGWGIDSLKVDGCYINNTADYAVLYPEFGAQLQATNRPIVYYCSWPAYIIGSANFTQIAQYCNGWRSYDDIQDSSDSLYSIVNWYGANSESQGILAASGPGAWNDADQLIVGDFGLSFSQMQMQMALWAIMASPMLMSNDLRKFSFFFILFISDMLTPHYHQNRSFNGAITSEQSHHRYKSGPNGSYGQHDPSDKHLVAPVVDAIAAGR